MNMVEDCHTISEYIFIIYSSIIVKHQKFVILSTIKSEYIDITYITKEAI